MLRDFLDERRVLTLAGRAFEVRKVSFGAVVSVHSKFGEKIALALRAGKSDALSILDSFTVGDVADLLCLVLSPPDRDFLVRNMSPALVEKVAEVVSEMNDLGRIFGSLSPPAPENAGEGEPPQQGGPTAMEVVLDAVAQRYGVAPHAAMEWPYEEVLSVLEIMRRQVSAAAPETSLMETGHEGVSPVTWPLIGAEYVDARKKANEEPN